MSQRPEKHGVFYPRGYVILTFESAEKADEVRQRLVEGGYDEEDVEVMDTERVKRGTSEDLRHLSPIIKALGTEEDLIRSHRTSAAEGSTEGAHKYDRFTITSL